MTDIAIIPAFDVHDLPPVAYRDKAVVTTEILAAAYATPEVNLRMNYQRNPERFVPGTHFFKLEGEELAKFRRLKITVSCSQISPKTRSLMLWTERGAARHAKMLNTDKAWDVFEAMEGYYFSRGKRDRERALEQRLIRAMEEKDALRAELDTALKKYIANLEQHQRLPAPRRQPMTIEEVEQVLALKEAGVSQAQIARELKRSEGIISLIVRGIHPVYDEYQRVRKARGSES